MSTHTLNVPLHLHIATVHNLELSHAAAGDKACRDSGDRARGTPHPELLGECEEADARDFDDQPQVECCFRHCLGTHIHRSDT